MFRRMRRAPWTKSEHEQLAAFYPFVSAQKLQKLLPDRTPRAICKHAFDLGIKKCHERIREKAHENISQRWHPQGLKTPEPPVQ